MDLLWIDAIEYPKLTKADILGSIPLPNLPGLFHRQLCHAVAFALEGLTDFLPPFLADRPM